MIKIDNNVELLAPGGDIEKAKCALDFGADAIYLGAKMFSLRARASNFDYDQVEELAEYAHSKNKKIYIVSNILAHNNTINNFDNFFKNINKSKPDGYITADPFVMKRIKELDPDANVHVSTQQSITNSKAALFFKKNGVERVVLARELTIAEIEKTTNALKGLLETECFIHGAVCISYSGRCVMSNNFSLRDANIGGCAQSCRWEWTLFDENKKVYTTRFSMSAKDMNQIENLEKIINAGVKSLKIEGRMKSLHYVATIVNNYAKAICEYQKTSKINAIQYKVNLDKAANRSTSTAWLNGRPGVDQMLYHEESRKLNQTFCFIVLGKHDEWYEILSKNKFDVSQSFELISKNSSEIEFKIDKIKDKNGNELDVVKTPMRKYFIKLNMQLNLAKNDLARIKQ